MTMIDSSGRAIKRSIAARTAPSNCSRVWSIRVSENSAVSDAARMALSTSKVAIAIGSSSMIIGRLMLPQLVPSGNSIRQPRHTIAAKQFHLMPLCDPPDPADWQAETAAQGLHRLTRTQAEQQLVILATAKGQRGVIADDRAISLR